MNTIRATLVKNESYKKYLDRFNSFSSETQDTLEKSFKIKGIGFITYFGLFLVVCVFCIFAFYMFTILALVIIDFFTHLSHSLVNNVTFFTKLIVAMFGIYMYVMMIRESKESEIKNIIQHGDDLELAKEKKHLEEVERRRKEEEEKSNQLLSTYRKQLELLYEYKEKGMDIERETFAMRKELIALERNENKEMIDDLLSTLEKL